MHASLLLSNLIETIATIHYRKLTIFLLLLYSYSLQVQGQSAFPPKQWDKTFGGPVDDYLRAVVAAPDGGYLLGGYSFQGGEGGGGEPNDDWYDYKIMKVDKDGNKEWDKVFDGNDYDFLSSIVTTSEGGYLLGGSSISGIGGDKSEESKGRHDYWVIKIDKDGKIEWDKTFGGNDVDLLYSVVTTADGGYLLGGNSSSNAVGDKSEGQRGLGDYWIVKIDSKGNKQWDKTFGGSNFEDFRSIIKTTDGGYLLGGGSQSGINGDKSDPTRGFYDYWIIKVDENGNKVWDKAFGGSNLDKITSMVATSDNGYLLGGESYSQIGGDKTERSRGLNDYWLVKTDSDGNKLWDKTYGGTSTEVLSTITVTSDNDYLLGGFSGSGISGEKSEASKGEYDYWIIKIDDSGNKQSDIAFGGNRSDNLVAIVATPDNGYLLGGDSFSGSGGDKSEPGFGRSDYWLIKLGVDIVKQDQTITFDPIPDQTFGDTAFTIMASASSELPLTFTVISGPATITNSTVTVTGAGTITIEASQDGNSTYNPAPSVSRSFLVSKATPAVTWDPVSLQENTPLGDEQLSAAATFKEVPVDGSFVYTPPAGTNLPVGPQTLKTDFTPMDTSNFNSVVDIARTVMVSPFSSSVKITSFLPSSGSVGSFVFITGNNFGKAQSVNFNGVSTTYTVLNPKLIIAAVPVATTGLISITESNGNAVFSSREFRISYPRPNIRFFTPVSGPAGKLVTIVGTNFEGTTRVLFNEISTLYFRVLNAYAIQALVPSGATTGKITVITPEGPGKSSINFTVSDEIELVTKNQAATVNAVSERESGASIYPNPFKNSFTLKLSGWQEGKAPATLYNIDGKVVLRIPNISSGQRIAVRNELKPGIYILEVGVGKDSKKYKVIKGY